MRPLSFSSALRSNGSAIAIARERTHEAWKVATIGPLAAQQASTPRLGTSGSWMCSTSKPPSRTQRRTRAAEMNPNDILATDPL